MCELSEYKLPGGESFHSQGYVYRFGAGAPHNRPLTLQALERAGLSLTRPFRDDGLALLIDTEELSPSWIIASEAYLQIQKSPKVYFKLWGGHGEDMFCSFEAFGDGSWEEFYGVGTLSDGRIQTTCQLFVDEFFAGEVGERLVVVDRGNACESVDWGRVWQGLGDVETIGCGADFVGASQRIAWMTENLARLPWRTALRSGHFALTT